MWPHLVVLFHLLSHKMFLCVLLAKISTSPFKKRKFLLLSALSFKTPWRVVILPLAEETPFMVWAILLPLRDHFTNLWLHPRGPMNFAFLAASICSIIIAIWFNHLFTIFFLPLVKQIKKLTKPELNYLQYHSTGGILVDFLYSVLFIIYFYCKHPCWESYPLLQIAHYTQIQLH